MAKFAKQIPSPGVTFPPPPSLASHLPVRLSFFLVLLFPALVLAAPEAGPRAEPWTAKELAQGFREHVLLARPRAAERATIDEAEAREGLRVRQKWARFDDVRVLELD